MIVFIIKLFGTLSRINKTLDEVNTKVEKLNGVFNIIDTTTDYLSLLSDKIVDKVTNVISSLFSKKDKKKEGEDEDE
jgi:uncharacterized protein YoxC